MPGISPIDFEPAPVISPPTRQKQTEAERLADYARRTGTTLIDMNMPSLQPGEYMGAGGSIISASSEQEAAKQQAALKEQQKSKETAEKTRSEAVQSWLEQLRAEQTAKALRFEEKTRIRKQNQSTTLAIQADIWRDNLPGTGKNHFPRRDSKSERTACLRRWPELVL